MVYSLPRVRKPWKDPPLPSSYQMWISSGMKLRNLAFMEVVGEWSRVMAGCSSPLLLMVLRSLFTVLPGCSCWKEEADTKTSSRSEPVASATTNSV